MGFEIWCFEPASGRDVVLKHNLPLLNVIGCGKVGRTLARLWSRRRVFHVQAILNRTIESGAAAAEFVGAGHAVSSYAELQEADLVMISAADEAIEDCCRRLCDAEVLGEGTIVFHCSGSLASSILEPAGAWALRSPAFIP